MTLFVFILVLPLSGLISVKNVAGIIQAVAYLQAEGITVYLHVVGDGIERQNLKQLAKKLNLTTQVKFYGELPNNLARQELTRANAFVLNSVHEGMPTLSLRL